MSSRSLAILPEMVSSAIIWMMALLAAALTGTSVMDSPSRLRRPRTSLFSQLAAALASTPLASSS